MFKVMKSFICRGGLNQVTSTGRTSVDISASANLELVDNFGYLGNMLSMHMDSTWQMQLKDLCRPIQILVYTAASSSPSTLNTQPFFWLCVECGRMQLCRPGFELADRDPSTAFARWNPCAHSSIIWFLLNAG